MAVSDAEFGGLKADIKNLCSTVEDIKKYLGKGIDQHTEVMSKLAVIESKQGDMTKYQDDCDTERRDHEKRITGVENYQENQLKVAGAVGGISGFFVTLIGLGIEYMRRG